MWHRHLADEFLDHRLEADATLFAQYLVEIFVEVRVKRIWPVRVRRPVAPVFIHPEPRRRIFSHIRLERIPTGLRNLLQTHSGGVRDQGMRHHAITSIGQRLAMRGHDRRAGALLQPGVRRRHTRLQPETIDRDRALTRWYREIDQQRRRALAPQNFVKTNDASFPRNEFMAGLLA